jgi:transcriptional regulator with XRE-family HTH domain
MQTPEAVKALRLAAGLTQIELCQLTKICPLTINEAETGERMMGGYDWILMRFVCNQRIDKFKEDS